MQPGLRRQYSSGACHSSTPLHRDVYLPLLPDGRLLSRNRLVNMFDARRTPFIVLLSALAGQDRSADVRRLHHLHMHGAYTPSRLHTMTGSTGELCIHHHAGASKGRTAAVSDAHATLIRTRKIDALAVRAKPVREGAPQQANGNRQRNGVDTQRIKCLLNIGHNRA